MTQRCCWSRYPNGWTLVISAGLWTALSIVMDVAVTRDLWRKRKRGDGRMDGTEDASRDDGASKR